MMTNNGYPLEWFVEPIDALLFCGVCDNVLKDPRTTNCGHIFCRKCIHAWIDEYGVCPSRCGELEIDNLLRDRKVEKKISCLLTGCRYTKVGCKAILKLADKEVHERNCHYAKKLSLLGKTRSFPFFNKFSLSQPDPAVSSYKNISKLQGATSESERVKRTTSQRTTKQRRISGTLTGFGGLKSKLNFSKRTLQPAPSIEVLSKPKVPKPMKMQSQHTYRLKRTKPRESLGLVLVSGDKTPDGRPLSFYVKGVNKDTLAAKSGIKPGDRIVQVDFYNLDVIPPQEAVARIKDKQLVTLTVLRGLVPPSKQKEDHIYDEIMYADQQLSQNLSQQEDFPQFTPTGILRENLPASYRPRTGQVSTEHDMLRRRPRSPSNVREQPRFITAGPGHTTHPGEKGSKDSGLSSGSSNSPEHKMKLAELGQVQFPDDMPFERLANIRQSYRTEREMVKNSLKACKKEADNGVTDLSEIDSRRNCRIEGEYEVEDIYIQKNGTSQLGVTLGYDKTGNGQLYVCEILPTGLVYRDGRLKCGDIIRRVNGFEVHDPEEAILLFLEQDQDITLTVARKIKAVSNRLILSNQTTVQPAVEHTYAILEQKLAGSSAPLRRIDSCGSLDSHGHKYAAGYKVAQLQEATDPQKPLTASMIKVNEAGYEYMGSSKSNPEPPHQLAISNAPRSSSRSPPRNPSPLCQATGAATQDMPIQRTPSPFRHTPSPETTHTQRMQRRYPSQEHLAHMAVNRPPQGRLPDNRQRGNRVNYEYRAIPPNTPAEGLKKAKSFRSINEVNSCKLATRSNSNDFVIHRSESLV